MSTAAISASGSGERRVREQRLLSLVRRCGERDESALAELYDETSQFVYGVALTVLRNPMDAEEITCDVFNQVWRAANSYSSGRGNVTSWLIIMARSRAIDRIRARVSKSKHELPFDKDNSFESVGVWQGPSPEQDATQSQQRRRIQRAMESLPAEQRKAIELAFFGGLTHQELAERLGEPLGTVKTRIRAGMTRLREALGSEVLH